MEISLRDFIITIKNTRIYGRNMVTLINKLFEAGNSIPIPSDETVKKWIAKTNPIKCPGEKYFDDKKKHLMVLSISLKME